MKNRFIALFLILTVFLAGCENTGTGATDGSGETVRPEETAGHEGTVSSEETVKTKEAGNTDETPSSGNTADPAGAEHAEEAADRAEAAPQRPLCAEDQKGCVIQEDENSIYICGPYRLVRIDKETGGSEILWDNAEALDNDSMFLYFQGSGLLLGDKLYFIEGDGYGTDALSVIHTDGTGYKKVMEPVRGTLLLQDGILYTASRNSVTCYKVYEDGTLSEAIDREGAEDFSEEVTKISYCDNGDRFLLAAEAIKKFGFSIYGYNPQEEKYWLTKMIPETGELIDMSQFGNSLEAYNSKYLLISSFGEGSWLVDAETLTGREFVYCCRADSTCHVITMDEDYVYMKSKVSEEGRTQYVYEKISIETGERSVICRQEEAKVWQNDIIDAVVKNGYLYYVKEIDYDLYLMRVDVDDPLEEEILGEALYESGISQVGSMEVYYEELTEERDNLKFNGTIDLKWLQVDDRFPGAAAVNRCLAEAQKQNIAYEKGVLKEESEADYDDWGQEEEWTFYFYCTSDLSGISYFDEHYLSFYQSEYDYRGGAHGMPFWIGYTFDLETGDRLALGDVIAEDEAALKDIVTGYFEAAVQANPDPGYYWSDAAETVRELTDLESSFYLTEKGITFYFEPYLLACFAAGIQEVTVPYEEFEMKIPVTGMEQSDIAQQADGASAL